MSQNSILPHSRQPAQPLRDEKGRSISGIVAPHHRMDCRFAWRVATPLLTVAGFGVAYLAAAYRSTTEHSDMQFLEFDQEKGVAGGMGALVGMATPTLVAGAQHVGRYLKDFCVRRCSDKPSADRIIQEALDASPLTLKGLMLQVERLEQVLEGDAAGLANALAALGKAISFDEEGCCDFGRSLDQLSFLTEKLLTLASRSSNHLSPRDCCRALLALADNLKRTQPLEEDQAKEMVTHLVSAADKVKHPQSEEHTEMLMEFALMLFDRATFRHIPADEYRTEVCRFVQGLKPEAILMAMPRPVDRSDAGDAAASREDMKSLDSGDILETPVAAISGLMGTRKAELRDAVGRTIASALHPSRNPFDQADYLLSVYKFLAGSQDLDSGMFMAGLLTPEQVKSLCIGLAGETDYLIRDRTERMAALPRLCQFQMNTALIESVQKQIDTLVSRNPDQVITRNWQIAPSCLRSKTPSKQLQVIAQASSQHPTGMSSSNSAEMPPGGSGASLSSGVSLSRFSVPLAPLPASAVKEADLAATDFDLVELGAGRQGFKEGKRFERGELGGVEGAMEPIDADPLEVVNVNVTIHSTSTSTSTSMPHS